jgi:hypothetical protein
MLDSNVLALWIEPGVTPALIRSACHARSLPTVISEIATASSVGAICTL